MIVRCFEPGDRDDFLRLCRDFYESHATLRPFDADISQLTFEHAIKRHANLSGYLMVDKQSTEPIGYALITSYWCNEEGGKVVVLDELYISPKNRHKGYATKFMEWLEKEYRGRAVSVSLEVLNDNVTARQLYAKEGFAPDGFITYSKRIQQ